MEVAAVAQRQDQEHLQSIFMSGVVADTHHADPTIVRSPIKEGTMVTDNIDDILEETPQSLEE